MCQRTKYRNGDEITLSCGCDDCTPSMINGVLCHEQGCRDAWRDYKVECRSCFDDFYRSERFQVLCDNCINGDAVDELEGGEA